MYSQASDILQGNPPERLVSLFLLRVIKPTNKNACWSWNFVRKASRGVTRPALGGAPAAYLSWWMAKGFPVPEGKWLLHRCDNGECTNPRHLFLGTALANSRDMVKKKRAWWQQESASTIRQMAQESKQRRKGLASAWPVTRILVPTKPYKTRGVTSSLTISYARLTMWLAWTGRIFESNDIATGEEVAAFKVWEQSA